MNKLQLNMLLVIAAILFATDVMAQVPQGFNFQALARDSEGELITGTNLGVRISVVQGTETGAVVYTETQTPTTNEIGIFQLVIGEGTSEDDFGSIEWAGDNYYVKLEIDPEGGTEYEELGTTRLLSVPYALLAQDVVNTGSNEEYDDFIQIDNENVNLQDSLTIARTGSDDESGFSNGVKIVGKSTGNNRPLRVFVEEDEINEGSQYAVSGTASGAGTGTHIGMIGTAWNPEATGNTRYGVYGQAASQAKYNYGVNGVAVGAGNGDEGEGMGEGSINFGIYGYAEANAWNNTGIEARAGGTAGKFNTGVTGMSGAGTGSTVKNHGVVGRAYGPGVNYGVYGTSWDGAENYAGYFDGETVVNGTLTVNGDINHTGSITETSDRNLKENIQPLENALNTIMKLNPTTYNFRGNGNYKGLQLSGGLHYGLIAQEVEGVLPSLVKNNVHRYTEVEEEAISGPSPSNAVEKEKIMEYKSMNYTELIPFLVKAVQEQQEEIEQLKKELEELRK